MLHGQNFLNFIAGRESNKFKLHLFDLIKVITKLKNTINKNVSSGRQIKVHRLSLIICDMNILSRIFILCFTLFNSNQGFKNETIIKSIHILPKESKIF